jgi:hypothetical protein
MGGWVTALTAAHDHQLSGAILISAADMASFGARPHEQIVKEMADDMESLNGVSAESMANELTSIRNKFSFDQAVDGLVQTPLLVLSADDGLAPSTNMLINAIKAKGGNNITAIHIATDHSWSDHRVFLESTVITWLAGLH